MRLFILVMSHLDCDPDNWRYSGQASHLADLQALTCYADPPRTLPRETFLSVARWPLPSPLPPCGVADATPVHGTIHELEGV